MKTSSAISIPSNFIFFKSLCRGESKMAELLMNYSCPRRQFILALRSGKTCCAVCGSQTTDIFSQVGLQQHYRIRHRGTEFDDNALKDGMKCLRKFAANETKENLIDFHNREKIR
jgi:hypothetical protein